MRILDGAKRQFTHGVITASGRGLSPIDNKSIETKTVTFIADGMQTTFSVGESIGFLFYVSINGLLQERDVDYYHIAQTSKITFSSPPPEGSTIMISYYPGRNSVFIDSYGKPLFLENALPLGGRRESINFN